MTSNEFNREVCWHAVLEKWTRPALRSENTHTHTHTHTHTGRISDEREKAKEKRWERKSEGEKAAKRRRR